MADLDFTKLNGALKTLYAKSYQDLVPEGNFFYKNLKFSNAEKLGDTFKQMVILTAAHGVTYGGSSATGYTLVDANPMTSAVASINGYEFTLREILPIGAIKRAYAEGPASFVNLWTLAYEKMMSGLIDRLELSFMYGGQGIGTALSSANVNATSTNVTFTTDTWQAGIWSGRENAQVSFYTSNTTLVSSAADSVFTVTTVDPENRKVKFTGTATGITALDAAILANPSLVRVYFAGKNGSTPYSSFGNEPVGIQSIISNTGTLFGINAASYGLWRGNTYSAGNAAFNFGNATQAISQVYSRTAVKGDFTFVVSPATWNNLNTNESANRIYDSTYDKGRIEKGAKSITYHSQNGSVTFEPHHLMKEGMAFGLSRLGDSTAWRKVGSTEVTNQFQGSEKMVDLVADRNAVEVRLYADLAPFCSNPSANILITNISNL